MHRNERCAYVFKTFSSSKHSLVTRRVHSDAPQSPSRRQYGSLKEHCTGTSKEAVLGENTRTGFLTDSVEECGLELNAQA